VQVKETAEETSIKCGVEHIFQQKRIEQTKKKQADEFYVIRTVHILAINTSTNLRT
jgi:hypothetical protein